MTLTKKEMIWLKDDLYNYNYTNSKVNENRMGKLIKKAAINQIKFLIKTNHRHHMSVVKGTHEYCSYSHFTESFIKELLKFRKQKKYSNFSRWEDAVKYYR